MSARKGLKPHATKTSASTLRAIVLVMALVALWPTATWAGTIGIALDPGSVLMLTFGGNDSSLTATGQSFSFGAASGPFFVPPTCATTCQAGTSFLARTSVFGAIGGGVTLFGISTPVNDAPVLGSAFASWAVTAVPFVLPPLGSSFTLMEPFDINLTVSIPPLSTVVQAGGAGTATFTFTPAQFGSSWVLTSGVYTVTQGINPVPEPSTWLLVPTAVGLA